jgi:hypothetical protein
LGARGILCTSPGRIEAEGEAVQLDQISLAALLDCPEVRTVDQDIATALRKPLGEEPFFPSYLLKMLSAAGVHTVAQARAGVAQHAKAIVCMVKPYFAFAFQAWRLSPEQMPHILRGYSLFFLAHAVLLESASLGIDKVERLAHLYRELDYPEDEGAAQRVGPRCCRGGKGESARFVSEHKLVWGGVSFPTASFDRRCEHLPFDAAPH